MLDVIYSIFGAAYMSLGFALFRYVFLDSDDNDYYFKFAVFSIGAILFWPFLIIIFTISYFFSFFNKKIRDR